MSSQQGILCIRLASLNGYKEKIKYPWNTKGILKLDFLKGSTVPLCDVQSLSVVDSLFAPILCFQ